MESMDQPQHGRWGKVAAYTELARASRSLAAGGVERRYWYILCRERTPHGAVFFYIKSRVETWDEGRLTGEDFAVQRLPGRNDEQAARQSFGRLAEARVPVSPVHLTDILRDLALLAAEHPSRWTLPPRQARRHPPARRRAPVPGALHGSVPRPTGLRKGEQAARARSRDHAAGPRAGSDVPGALHAGRGARQDRYGRPEGQVRPVPYPGQDPAGEAGRGSTRGAGAPVVPRGTAG